MTDLTLASLGAVLLDYKGNDVWALQKVYEFRMLSILDEMLKKKTWALDEFLMLTTGVRFWSLLMSQCRENKEKEITENVEYVVKRMLKSYDKKNTDIRNSDLDKEVNRELTPISWLELSEKLKIEIDSKIHRRVLLTHFGLDWRMAENRIDRGITLNEDQAAKFLTKKLGITISPKNVLEMCVKSEGYSFGAYIDYKKYCDFQKNDISIMSLAVIEDAVQEGIIDSDYLYGYEGLIRLIKENKQDEFDEFISGQSIKHIRDGGIIEIGRDIPLLCLQRSLGDLILGRYQIMAVKRKVDLQQITSCNLLYREEELERFAEAYLKLNPVDEDDQLLGRPAIKKIYTDVSKHQWDKVFSNEEQNGLIAAKVIGVSSRQDRYIQSKLHMWLIENGHYTPKELLKLTRETQSITGMSIANILQS